MNGKRYSAAVLFRDECPDCGAPLSATSDALLWQAWLDHVAWVNEQDRATDVHFADARLTALIQDLPPPTKPPR